VGEENEKDERRGPRTGAGPPHEAVVDAETPPSNGEKGNANRKADHYLGASTFFRGWNKQADNRRDPHHAGCEPKQKRSQALGSRAKEKDRDRTEPGRKRRRRRGDDDDDDVSKAVRESQSTEGHREIGQWLIAQEM